jgi:putative ATP-binding cassette transporter
VRSRVDDGLRLRGPPHRQSAAHHSTWECLAMRMTRPGFWRDLWALTRPYWQSEEKLTAWALLIVLVGLTLGMVYINVQFNSWYNDFYNSLQDRNMREFWAQLIRYAMLAAGYILMAVLAFYLNQMLQIRWRRWMTERYLQEWLADRAYYRMQLTGGQTDNPDQRVAEDLKLFVDESLTLSLGLLNAVATLAVFVGILWALSGTLTFALAGTSYEIPGYMVWAAAGYAIAGTWLTHKLGKPLIGLNFEQQRFEADFRFNLVRFRENTEGVALYRGEAGELSGFRARFANVAANWWALMKRQTIVNFFTIGYTQVAVIFPFVVAAPRYFSGAIPLGGLIQISNAFAQVQGALSWFVNAYPVFASWKATVDRLNGFHHAVMDAQAGQRNDPGVRVESTDSTSLELANVDLDLPSGRTLLAGASARIAQGARVLVRGPSGSGKSTLFRAIAGIWPFGRGYVRVPAGFQALFLPQRPYFPLGTLRAAVAYPAAAEAFDDAAIKAALAAVGLPHLVARLEEEATWPMQLSVGEQQRIAFARALLHRPAWLFLDEATSALDEPAQAALLELLHERLGETSIVSIAHRPAPAPFHDRVLDIVPGSDGEVRALRAAAA